VHYGLLFAISHKFFIVHQYSIILQESHELSVPSHP
jgi:hypothetical protein